MLTVKDFNRITFLHHRGIVPPSPAKEGGDGGRKALCMHREHEVAGVWLCDGVRPL